MLMVGPRTTCAPFACASSPSKRPISTASSESKVAPMAVPQGRHAEGTLPKNLVPRMPLGPSESRIDGTESRGISRVCQKSLPGHVSVRAKVCLYDGLCLPARSETFSSMFNCSRTSSTDHGAKSADLCWVALSSMKGAIVLVNCALWGQQDGAAAYKCVAASPRLSAPFNISRRPRCSYTLVFARGPAWPEVGRPGRRSPTYQDEAPGFPRVTTRDSPHLH